MEEGLGGGEQVFEIVFVGVEPDAVVEQGRRGAEHFEALQVFGCIGGEQPGGETGEAATEVKQEAQAVFVGGVAQEDPNKAQGHLAGCGVQQGDFAQPHALVRMRGGGVIVELRDCLASEPKLRVCLNVAFWGIVGDIGRVVFVEVKPPAVTQHPVEEKLLAGLLCCQVGRLVQQQGNPHAPARPFGYGAGDIDPEARRRLWREGQQVKMMDLPIVRITKGVDGAGPEPGDNGI